MTMKHTSKLIGSCVLATTILATGAHAATRTDGLNACAKAAVAELGSRHNADLDYSLSADTRASGVKLKNRELFHLDISNPQNDEVIARVDCYVDKEANVRDLKKVPLDGKDAIVRAES
jgi:hypothetical protein